MLQFHESSHTYTHGDTKLPSVSEVMKFAGLGANYAGISGDVMETARSRGVRLDAITEQIDMGLDPSPDPDIAGYVMAYEKFVNETGFRAVASQSPMWHPTRLYAGTPDRVGMLTGKLTMLDLKTTSMVHRKSCAIQLDGAYSPMWDYHSKDRWIERNMVLHLKPEGKYTLVCVDHDLAQNVFLSAVEEFYGRQSGATNSVLNYWKMLNW